MSDDPDFLRNLDPRLHPQASDANHINNSTQSYILNDSHPTVASSGEPFGHPVEVGGATASMACIDTEESAQAQSTMHAGMEPPPAYPTVSSASAHMVYQSPASLNTGNHSTLIERAGPDRSPPGVSHTPPIFSDASGTGSPVLPPFMVLWDWMESEVLPHLPQEERNDFHRRLEQYDFRPPSDFIVSAIGRGLD
ncbi:unnamed protein product, partial [Peniophora sp. CBMAI 1063]